MRRMILLFAVVLSLMMPGMAVFAQQNPFQESVTETHAQKVYEHVKTVLEEEKEQRAQNRIDYGERGKNPIFRAYMWLRRGFLKKIFWLELSGIIGCFLFWNNKHLVRSIFLTLCVGLPFCLILILFMGGNKF